MVGSLRDRIGVSRNREMTSHAAVPIDRSTAIQPHKYKDSQQPLILKHPTASEFSFVMEHFNTAQYANSPIWNYPTGSPCQPEFPAFLNLPPCFRVSSPASRCAFGFCAAASVSAYPTRTYSSQSYFIIFTYTIGTIYPGYLVPSSTFLIKNVQGCIKQS